MHAMLTLDDLRPCVQALDGSGAGSFEERSSTDPKKTGEVDLRGKSASQTDAYVADTQELIDLIETVYRGARKGRGLVVSPKDYSTKYRY